MTSDIDMCPIHDCLRHRRRDSKGRSKGWCCPECEAERKRVKKRKECPTSRTCPIHKRPMKQMESGGEFNGWRCLDCHRLDMQARRRSNAEAKRAKLLSRTKRPRRAS